MPLKFTTGMDLDFGMPDMFKRNPFMNSEFILDWMIYVAAICKQHVGWDLWMKLIKKVPQAIHLQKKTNKETARHGKFTWERDCVWK